MNKMQEWKPEKECQDANCPYHGEISVRGRQFTGKVTADRMHKTVNVQWDGRKYWPKYERYAKRTSDVKAHNPPCIDAKTGNRVLIAETRRLSKTKNFVIVKILEETEEITSPVKEVTEEEPEEPVEEESDEAGEEETTDESDEDTEDTPELKARSTVKGMTKDEIKEYAKEFGVELSTNDLKKEMIDQLFEEVEQ